MNKIKQKYAVYLNNREFLASLAFSVLILLASLVINFYAVTYATARASNAVTDLILDNIRVYDVDGIFIYGPIFFYLFVAYILIMRPHLIPFTLKSMSLFILIRAIFISLTHLGPSPLQLVISPANIMNYFTPGGDLFFSGHTGLPFLLALIFWENIRFRVFFIASALLFGAIVLLGHMHYSIDVLAAFFITYTIYRIASAFFPKDKKIFASGLEHEN
ncbi:MAG: phosphatase PAP2-related protein [Candidatus Giovannonibacteria bacterium]|nr:phosphatase PAP2-related protein [Candidatus Giovannonibacteria bacterium]